MSLRIRFAVDLDSAEVCISAALAALFGAEAGTRCSPERAPAAKPPKTAPITLENAIVMGVTRNTSGIANCRRIPDIFMDRCGSFGYLSKNGHASASRIL